MIRYKSIGLVLVLCLHQVICIDYAEELQKKYVQKDELLQEIELLNDELQDLVKQGAVDEETLSFLEEQLTTDKLTEMKSKFVAERDNIRNETDARIIEKDEEFRRVAKNVSVDKYFTRRFNGVINLIKSTEKNYDKDSKSVRDLDERLTTIIEDKQKEYNPIIDEINKKSISLLGNLTEEQKIEKRRKVNEIRHDFYTLTRQVMINEFHEEEKLRSDGNSGIKQIRSGLVGSKNYHSNTHSGRSFSAIHNHASNIRTVGMGEFIGVLNGVEFRTRHNDYRLKKAVVNDKRYHKTENVEFPSVPPEVLNAGDIDAQVIEMREWFKAFYAQDYSKRDYRKYFRPHLVYLEGAWQVGKEGDPIDEPFESDRHHIDATTWLDLQEKVRFTSYAGQKSLLENLSHLPTKFMRLTENKTPVLAQWNYRLLCHPIQGDLSTKVIKLVSDPATQKRNRMNDETYRNSRSAKFEIDGVNIDGKRENGPMTYSFLDQIMEQIPGKDNYGASINAKPFDDENFELYTAHPTNRSKLNAAYYHRAYIKKDLRNEHVKFEQRGFSDRLYVAHTTQDRIAHATYSNGEHQVNAKVSYAVPVEIIYITPLSRWNPYNLSFVKTKTGSGSLKRPFNGISDRQYYITPHSFYASDETDTDPADTAKAGALFIKSSMSSKPKAVRASGIRIMFPKIPGIDGNIRQRYPIMPIHGEGSAVWKKLNALEDAMNIHNPVKSEFILLATGISHSTFTTGHNHMIEIDKSDYMKLINGEITTLKLTTNQANGHVHEITIGKMENENNIYIADCAGDWERDNLNHPDQVCMDYHENTLSKYSQ